MKSKVKLYRLISTILAVSIFTVLLNQAPNVSAVASQAQLQNNVIVYLYNKQLMPSDEGQVALVTLMIDNQSSNEVDLIDYWARIKGGNKSYTTKLTAQDENKKTILPGNKEYLSYYAAVSNDELITDINVDVIKWDFSKDSYESVVGNLVVAENNQPGLNEVASVRIGNIHMQAMLEDQFIYEEIDNKVISFRIKLTNDLNREADISSFNSYAIINKDELYEASTIITETTVKSKSDTHLYGQVSVPKDTVIDSMNIALVAEQDLDIYPLLVFPVGTLSERATEKSSDEFKVSYNGDQFTLKGKDVTASSEGNRAIIEMSFDITNNSNRTALLENMLFYVKTNTGLIYSLQQDENNPKQLLPEITESFIIRGYVPNEQVLADSQFMIGAKLDDKQVIIKNVTLATPKLDSTEINKTAIKVNGQEVQFNRLSRMPNSQYDLIVAEFTIKNTTDTSKKPLELSGEFIIDGVKVDAKQTKLIRMNSNLTLLPNETERVVAYINVPFTQTITDFEFNLSINGKFARTIDMVESFGDRLLAQNEKYLLKTLGKRAEVTYYNSSIYEGPKDDLFVVELLVKNVEKRNVVPSQLNGYIESLKGEIYQLEFEEYPNAIMPNGDIIVVGSTKVPRSLLLTDLEIHFGEQLQAEETIYTDPVYVLHKSTNVVKSNLIDMVNVSDKKFWVWNTTKTWLMSDGTIIDGLKVDIDYQIDDLINSVESLGEKNIQVEYIDLTMPTIKVSKSIPLSGSEGVLGRGLLSLSYSNPTVPYGVLLRYDINVYEEYKGYRKLIMSEEFNH